MAERWLVSRTTTSLRIRASSSRPRTLAPTPPGSTSFAGAWRHWPSSKTGSRDALCRRLERCPRTPVPVAGQAETSVQVAVRVPRRISILRDQAQVARPRFQLPLQAPGPEAQQPDSRAPQLQVPDDQNDPEGFGGNRPPVLSIERPQQHEAAPNQCEDITRNWNSPEIRLAAAMRNAIRDPDDAAHHPGAEERQRTDRRIHQCNERGDDSG